MNPQPLSITALGTANSFIGLTNDRSAPLLIGPDHPRGNCALYIRYGSFSALVDLGEGVVDAIIGGSLPLPDVVLVTHSHVDHLGTASVDRLARWAKIAGKKLIFISTRATWMALGGYHQNHFEFREITPGQCLTLGDGKVSAIDASAHWPGALNYVIALGGRRIGVLFDRKSWLDLTEPSVLEGLDLAYFDFNQLLKKPKTGHLSIAENLDFIRKLTKPPRLAIGLHYGTDDHRVLTQGSLTSLLAGLAPDLNIRLAWPGMTIDMDDLPPRNAVAVLDEATNLPCRAEEKAFVHESGLLHSSVLLLVKRAPGKVLVGVRPAGKQDAGKIDCFGGHCRPDDFPDPSNAALREGEEELAMLKGGFLVRLNRGWLTQIGPAFALECLDAQNREKSTLFGLTVPEGVDDVMGSDDIDSGEVKKLETRIVTWDELLSMYRDSPVQFADGLGRILKRALEDASFDRQVREFLA